MIVCSGILLIIIIYYRPLWLYIFNKMTRLSTPVWFFGGKSLRMLCKFLDITKLTFTTTSTSTTDCREPGDGIQINWMHVDDDDDFELTLSGF